MGIMEVFMKVGSSSVVGLKSCLLLVQWWEMWSLMVIHGTLKG